MADLVFPDRPALPWPEAAAVELVVRDEPLAAIQQGLSISIHDVVNDCRWKRRVADFYRLSRRIENESWLRRQVRAQEQEAWVAAHL